MTLTFWHICNASFALDFARSTSCLSTPVQSVKKLLCPNPNWTSTTLSGMRKRNVTNVEICSKKETLQGTVKSIWTKILCSHAKYVQRLLTERIICTHMLSNAMMSHCHRSNTNVMTVNTVLHQAQIFGNMLQYIHQRRILPANTVHIALETAVF